MSKDDEVRPCKVTDGLYEEGHPACEACCEKAKKVCQVFAMWNGLLDQEDIIKKRKGKDR